MNDPECKLLRLADACSDALFGGECGWESMDFDHFVTECAKAIQERNRLVKALEYSLAALSHGSVSVVSKQVAEMLKD